MLDSIDWKSNPMIFQGINNLLDTELLASRLSIQCQFYFSWWPEPFALATDSFLWDWTAMKC